MRFRVLTVTFHRLTAPRDSVRSVHTSGMWYRIQQEREPFEAQKSFVGDVAGTDCLHQHTDIQLSTCGEDSFLRHEAPVRFLRGVSR